MTNIHLQTNIPPELAGERLDVALAKQFPEHSRSRIKNWIADKCVRVNGKIVKPRDKVSADDAVEILATVSTQNNWEGQNIALDIIYEDDDLLVINKPIGLVVHPGAGNPDSTLVNALLHHCPDLSNIPRCGIVHRIDKDTSGLLVVAKTLQAQTSLVQQLQKHEVAREYLAICHGSIISGGTIDKAIGRHPKKRTQMAVAPLGKPAITHYRTIEKFKGFTYVQVNLETGRTHQIRVHFADMNHPLVGDQTYGNKTLLPKNPTESLKSAIKNFKRQALHAHSLTLTHPTSKQEMRWTVDMPEDMQALLDILRDQPNG